jgi:hypothetical protein
MFPSYQIRNHRGRMVRWINREPRLTFGLGISWHCNTQCWGELLVSRDGEQSKLMNHISVSSLRERLLYHVYYHLMNRNYTTKAVEGSTLVTYEFAEIYIAQFWKQSDFIFVLCPRSMFSCPKCFQAAWIACRAKSS